MTRKEAMAGRSDPPDPDEVRARIAQLTELHRKNPWSIDADVYLRPSSSPPFEVQSCLETNRSKRVFFRNRRRPGFIIRFRLHDEEGSGYRFPRDANEAVWSQAGGKCPHDSVWDIFKPIQVDSSGTVLEVFNENPRPAIGRFKYSLRVIRDGDPDGWLLDPPGSNENGQLS